MARDIGRFWRYFVGSPCQEEQTPKTQVSIVRLQPETSDAQLIEITTLYCIVNTLLSACFALLNSITSINYEEASRVCFSLSLNSGSHAYTNRPLTPLVRRTLILFMIILFLTWSTSFMFFFLVNPA